MKEQTTTSGRLDFFGFWASALCAVHCAVTPLVLTISALGGLAFLADPSVEVFIIAISLLLAASSLWPSWRKHGRWEMMALALLGFACIALGHELGHELQSIYPEAILAAAGGTTVALAHWWNALVVKKLAG